MEKINPIALAAAAVWMAFYVTLFWLFVKVMNRKQVKNAKDFAIGSAALHAVLCFVLSYFMQDYVSYIVPTAASMFVASCIIACVIKPQ